MSIQDKFLNRKEKIALEKFEETKKLSEVLIKDKEKTLAKIDKADNMTEKLSNGKFQKALDGFLTMTKLVKSYIKGDYRENIDKKTVIAFLASIVYVVNPIDAIPDAIPAIGFIDDAFIVGMMLKSGETILKNYKHWLKGRGKIQIDKKINETIVKMNKSIMEMQFMLIIKFVLYVVILMIAIISRTYIIDSSLPVLIIGAVYLFMFLLLVSNTVRIIKLYKKNSIHIKKYLPSYFVNRKNGNNKEAIAVLIQEYIDDEIIVEKEQHGKLKNTLIKMFKRAKVKSKTVQEIFDDFCGEVSEEVLNNIDKSLRKKFNIYLASLAFYLLVAFLSNEFIVNYYYQSRASAILYPFKYILFEVAHLI